MTKPRTLDASPLSEFITKMRDVHRRRLAAVSVTDKREIEREMVELMQHYLGRNAWDAAAAAEAEAKAAEPSAGRRGAYVRRRVRPGPAPRYTGDGVDRKLAAAGERTDDD